MNTGKGRVIHRQAEDAREKEQDFAKSLQLTDEAIVSYQADSDYRGLSEVMGSRALAWDHLYQKTGDKVFLILAKNDAKVGVEIAEILKDPTSLAMAYKSYAKALESAEQWAEAAKYFQMTLEEFSKNAPPEHNRPAVIADIKAHLAHTLYMSGDKDMGLSLMEEAIKELAESDEGAYNKNVWLSGAHMRFANMLSADNPGEAKRHLELAEEIVNNNPELVLRKEQLKRLKGKLA